MTNQQARLQFRRTIKIEINCKISVSDQSTARITVAPYHQNRHHYVGGHCCGLLEPIRCLVSFRAWIFAIMGFETCGPNEVMVVSGTKCSYCYFFFTSRELLNYFTSQLCGFRGGTVSWFVLVYDKQPMSGRMLGCPTGGCT